MSDDKEDANWSKSLRLIVSWADGESNTYGRQLVRLVVPISVKDKNQLDRTRIFRTGQVRYEPRVAITSRAIVSNGKVDAKW